MPPRALVTGATGCVGANVVEALLAQGYRVRAMRRAASALTALESLEPELVVGDVLDPASLESAIRGCELVFHVAAISDYWRSGAARTYNVNVQGTKNVVGAAMASGVDRLVYTSSIGALGLPRPGQLLDESTPRGLPPARFVYGRSKYMAEQAVAAAVARGLDAVTVNPTGVIGARDVHFIGGSLLREAKRGLTWITFSGGLNWVDAGAVGIGHVLAAERGRTGGRYILGGENISHRRAMEIAAQVVGGRRPVVTLPRGLVRLAAPMIDWWNVVWPRTPVFSGEQARLSGEYVYADSGLAHRELGLPVTGFRKGAENAYAWYRAHGFM
jgi:dihydroflavonol-4-reductase